MDKIVALHKEYPARSDGGWWSELRAARIDVLAELAEGLENGLLVLDTQDLERDGVTVQNLRDLFACGKVVESENGGFSDGARRFKLPMMTKRTWIRVVGLVPVQRTVLRRLEAVILIPESGPTIVEAVWL